MAYHSPIGFERLSSGRFRWIWPRFPARCHLEERSVAPVVSGVRHEPRSSPPSTRLPRGRPRSGRLFPHALLQFAARTGIASRRAEGRRGRTLPSRWSSTPRTPSRWPTAWSSAWSIGWKRKERVPWPSRGCRATSISARERWAASAGSSSTTTRDAGWRHPRPST